MKRHKCVHLCFWHIFTTILTPAAESLWPLAARPGPEKQTGLHLPPTSRVPPTLKLGDFWVHLYIASCLVWVLSMMYFIDISSELTHYTFGWRKNNIFQRLQGSEAKRLQNCQSLFSWLYTQ